MSSLRRKFGIGLVAVLAAIGLSAVMFDGDIAVRRPTQNKGIFVSSSMLGPSSDDERVGSTSSDDWGREEKKTRNAHRAKASKPGTVAKRDVTAEVDAGMPPDTLVYWDGTVDDGSRRLVADVPMFSILYPTSRMPYLVDFRMQLRILGSEMADILARHPEIPDTIWVETEVERRVRYVRDGRVIVEEAADTLTIGSITDILVKYLDAPARWNLP